MASRAFSQISKPSEPARVMLDGELGGDAPRDLVVAAHDAYELRVVVALGIQQLAELGGDEARMRQALDRAQRVMAGGAARGGIITC